MLRNNIIPTVVPELPPVSSMVHIEDFGQDGIPVVSLVARDASYNPNSGLSWKDFTIKSRLENGIDMHPVPTAFVHSDLVGQQYEADSFESTVNEIQTPINE